MKAPVVMTRVAFHRLLVEALTQSTSHEKALMREALFQQLGLEKTRKDSQN